MHHVFTREKKTKIPKHIAKTEHACKIGSNKENEWPLMSTPINKAKLRITVGVENEVV